MDFTDLITYTLTSIGMIFGAVTGYKIISHSIAWGLIYAMVGTILGGLAGLLLSLVALFATALLIPLFISAVLIWRVEETRKAARTSSRVTREETPSFVIYRK